MQKIDHSLISEEAIKGLAYQFVMQSMGNEWDEQPLDSKMEITLNKLKTGELIVVYSDLEESALIMPMDEFKKKFTQFKNESCNSYEVVS